MFGRKRLEIDTFGHENMKNKEVFHVTGQIYENGSGKYSVRLKDLSMVAQTNILYKMTQLTSINLKVVENISPKFNFQHKNSCFLTKSAYQVIKSHSKQNTKSLLKSMTTTKESIENFIEHKRRDTPSRRSSRQSSMIIELPEGKFPDANAQSKNKNSLQVELEVDLHNLQLVFPSSSHEHAFVIKTQKFLR
jgi:hypothetical protein